MKKNGSQQNQYLHLMRERILIFDGAMGTNLDPVSYTHLTLPTN